MQSLQLKKRVITNSQKQTPVARYVPLLHVLDGGVCLLKDGSLAKVFRIGGMDVETMSSDEKEQATRIAHDVAKNLDERVMVWSSVIRKKVQRDYAEQFGNPVLQATHDSYVEQFNRLPSFETSLYLTIVFNAELRNAKGVFDTIAQRVKSGDNVARGIALGLRDAVSGKKQYEHNAAQFGVALESFNQILADIKSGLFAFDMEGLDDEASVMSFYHSLINPEAMPIRQRGQKPPAVSLDSVIADITLSRDEGAFAPDQLTIDTPAGNKRYVAALAVHEWADFATAGVMDCILEVPGEITWTSVSSFIDDEKARDILGGIDNKLAMSFEKFSQLIGRAVAKGGYDEGGSGQGKDILRAEVREAHSRTFAERLRWTHSYFSILCYGKTADEANAVAVEVGSVLRRAGFIFHRERLHLLQAWASSLPGQYAETIGWWLLTLEYLANLIPLRKLDNGYAINQHLTNIRKQPSAALTVFRTKQGTDYGLDLHTGSAGRHDSDIGHFFLVAPSSRGKTVLANWIIMQYRRYDPTRIVVLDKDYSCKIPILLQGGDYLETSGSAGVKLNPLSLLQDDKHMPFLVGWLREIFAKENCDITPEEITKALSLLKESAPHMWRLGNLTTFLPQDAGNALRAWTQGEVYGALDNAEDGFQNQINADSYCIGIDLKRVFDDAHFGPVCLDYLLYCIEQATAYGSSADTARPGMIYIEEVWKLFQVPRLAGQLEDWLRTLRKRNFVVGMATQSLREIKDGGFYEILTDNIPNKFFLGNPEADKQKDLYEQFGLGEDDVQAIKGMQVGEFFYQKSAAIKKHLKFTATPTQLRALSCNEAALAEFEKLGQHNYMEAVL